MTWADVDFQAQRITIGRQMRRDGLFGPLKTAATRSRSGEPPTRILCSSGSKAARCRNVTHTAGYRRPRSAPELPPVRVHDLRHSLGSVLVAAGVPIPTVSRHLGHSNPATTMRIYARELDEPQRLGLVRDVLSRSLGSHRVATAAGEHA